MKFISIIFCLISTAFAITEESCKICNDPLRIMVLLDESGTVGKKNFEIAKHALNNLVDKLDISNISSQMGIIKFSTNSLKVINMSPDTKLIKKSINDMKYRGGWTNTKSAINMAMNIGSEYWESNDVTKILLIITDGLPQMNERKLGIIRELGRTLKVMDNFKDVYENVDVISIAIGEYAKNNEKFFKKISDYPVFLADNYTEVLNLFGNLTIDICTSVLKYRTLKNVILQL